MNKYIYIIVLFLFQATCFSQTSANLLDGNNKKHGLWVEKYKGTDIVKYTGEYKHGKETGVFKYFDKEGELRIEKKRLKRSNSFSVKMYNAGEKLSAEGMYVSKKKEGVWKYYEGGTSYLIMVETYKKGELNGVKKTFYKNGLLTQESYYKNNKLDGKVKRFTDKGVVFSMQTFKSGVLNGKVKYFEIDGVLIISGQYSDDKRVGKWTYFEGGKVKEVKDFDKITNWNPGNHKYPKKPKALKKADEKE